MEERIFFNQGNAVTSDVDLKALYIAAQIEKDSGRDKEPLVIAKDKRNNQYVLFFKEDFHALKNPEDYELVEELN
ncbi:hypothetical protein ACYSNU_12930 [Enterococcus sp. LJL120]